MLLSPRALALSLLLMRIIPIKESMYGRRVIIYGKMNSIAASAVRVCSKQERSKTSLVSHGQKASHPFHTSSSTTASFIVIAATISTMMMAFSLVARRCATRTAAALSRRHATIKYSERGLGYHLSRNFSTSLIPDDHNHHDDDDDESRRRPSSKRRSSTTIRRVWKATDEESSTTTRQEHRPDLWDYWEDPVLSKSEMLQAASNNNNDDSSSSSSKLDELLSTISSQEKRGGRMKQSQLGVLREDPSEDMRLLVENYTVPALASALRDREDVLQQCAQLLQKGDLDQLSVLLQPYQREYVLQRRITEETTLDLSEHGLTSTPLEQLRKALHRMPRRVTQAHQKRAGVVVALCNVDGVPSVLLEKRSKHLRAHPDEVCLPGGMVCSASDPTIVATCLREMGEEIEGLPEESIRVLGILRCNWGEVHHLVGVAVTPLVAFVGELGERVLRPNPSEVSQVFTIPLEEFMDRSLWIHREGLAPIFTGGPHPIWGLTGYILERFVKDILARYDIIWPKIE